MSITEAPTGVLRPRARESNQVLPVELFFDLGYVLAITQLTYHLLDHLTLGEEGATLVLKRYSSSGGLICPTPSTGLARLRSG